MPCHQSFSSSTGGARGRARLAPTKTFALACDINLGREIDVITCNGCAKSFWPAVSLAVCASC